MVGRRNLRQVCSQYRRCGGRLYGCGWFDRQEQCIQKLLLDYLQGCAKTIGDVGRRAATINVVMAGDRARQQEFAGEEVHTDLAAFPGAIVKQSFDADWRILRRTVWFDFLRYRVQHATFQDDMSQFMSDQKGAVEHRTSIFVQNASGLAIEYRTPAFQCGVALW